MTVLAALLLGGLALLVAEIFLPGIFVGIVGVVLWLTAIIYAGVNFGAAAAGWVLLIEIVGGTIFFCLWAKFFPKSRMSRSFRLEETQEQHASPSWEALLGKQGVAATLLRPSGVALIEGKRVDVVTEGLHVEKGKAVKVVAVEGQRVVVRPLDAAAA